MVKILDRIYLRIFMHMKCILGNSVESGMSSPWSCPPVSETFRGRNTNCNASPIWNEVFFFLCRNPTEHMKGRYTGTSVWNNKTSRSSGSFIIFAKFIFLLILFFFISLVFYFFNLKLFSYQPYYHCACLYHKMFLDCLILLF